MVIKKVKKTTKKVKMKAVKKPSKISKSKKTKKSVKNVKIQKQSKSAKKIVATNLDETLKDQRPLIKTYFLGKRVITEKTDLARELYNQSRYGAMLEDKTVQLSYCEALFLLEKGKITILNGKNKEFTPDSFRRLALKDEPNLFIRYSVFKDFRNRGYIIKTALKFGADFRVYDRGIKPGEDHAKWIVFPVKEAESLTWYEFSAKNRVAHSTKKRLLIASVDDEGDCTYWEVKWTRP